MMTAVAFLAGVLVGGLLVLGRVIVLEAQRDRSRLDGLRTIMGSQEEDDR